MGLIMNRSPTLPDRIISIPWLVFAYEGVSLSQMIYTPSASKKACDEENPVVSPAPRERITDWLWRKANEEKATKLQARAESKLPSLSNLRSPSDAAASLSVDQSASSANAESAASTTRIGEGESPKTDEGMMVRPSVLVRKKSEK